MSTLPARARAVVIGAGIVGNSVAFHLARLGWKELVLLDKGPLPNPGGSTGHASNFCFPIDYSKAMVEITRDSTRQYKALGVFRECGGIEVARCPERMTELKRRFSAAKTWGIKAELVGPERVGKLFPWINPKAILGGLWMPETGVVDSVRAGTIMRETAEKEGALHVSSKTEVKALEVENGRIKAVVTDKGRIEAETVVICCGVWSPRLARMAGATIPLYPAVHQMIDAGPISAFSGSSGEISNPIIRDMTKLMYERQSGQSIEIGSYAHRPILHAPDDIPSIEASKLSPTELPFTMKDFEPQMADALALMPELLDTESVEIHYAINGLISLTPDGEPVLGETVEVKGLWSAAAVWIKEAPGVGRMVAEWMTHGSPEIDHHEFDLARFYEYARNESHVVHRATEGYNKIYGVVHPMEQWASSRLMRTSPFYFREKELGAAFYETAGWERPHWYESNQKLLEVYGDRVMPRSAEWDRRWWSPIINAEHLNLRDHGAMIDISALNVFDLTGSKVMEFLQRMAVAQVDVAPGKSVYTSFLNAQGGIRADLTIIRRGPNAYRVITGSMDGGRDRKWLLDNMPTDGSVHLDDRTSARGAIGVWGPKARPLLQKITRDDVSNEAFPYGSAREITIGSVKVWAFRISYVGELGWELHIPTEHGLYVWDRVREAGEPLGFVPAGIGVYGTTARLEKCYRLYGPELANDYNLVETGMARPKVKPQDFVGKKAYLKFREEPPAAVLCTLTVDDHRSQSGEKRFMLGKEPILTLEGKSIVDRKGRCSFATSAGSVPSLQKHALMAFLPPEYAKVGTKLKVEYFAEQYPVTVATAGATALFDPNNDRMKV